MAMTSGPQPEACRQSRFGVRPGGSLAGNDSSSAWSCSSHRRGGLCIASGPAERTFGGAVGAGWTADWLLNQRASSALTPTAVSRVIQNPDFDIRMAVLLQRTLTATPLAEAAKSLRLAHGCYLQFWLFHDTI